MLDVGMPAIDYYGMRAIHDLLEDVITTRLDSSTVRERKARGNDGVITT